MRHRFRFGAIRNCLGSSDKGALPFRKNGVS
jgi:hypothetical protein